VRLNSLLSVNNLQSGGPCSAGPQRHPHAASRPLACGATVPAQNWPSNARFRRRRRNRPRARRAPRVSRALSRCARGHALRGEDAADQRPRWPAVDGAAKTPPAEAACARRLPSSRYQTKRYSSPTLSHRAWGRRAQRPADVSERRRTISPVGTRRRPVNPSPRGRVHRRAG
jgi:hypothetical protein